MHSTKTPSTTQDDTLSLLRELAEFVIDDDDEDVHSDDAMAAACRLASLFLKLDRALREGAQVPTAWRLAGRPAADLGADSRRPRTDAPLPRGPLLRRRPDDTCETNACACCGHVTTDLWVQFLENAPGQHVPVFLCAACLSATDVSDPEQALRVFYERQERFAVTLADFLAEYALDPSCYPESEPIGDNRELLSRCIVTIDDGPKGTRAIFLEGGIVIVETPWRSFRCG